MIEFKNVTKVYENGTVALQDINLSIEQGEFVFVVGASGKKKSTFLGPPIDLGSRLSFYKTKKNK